jgi:hypothetical protein
MNLEYSPQQAPEPLLAAWIKWTMDFWESMAQMGPGRCWSGEAAAPPAEAGEADSCLAALNLWQAFFSLLSEPGTVAAVFRGIKAPSEVILRIAQAGWRGYFYLHQQWLEGLDQEAAPPESDGFENLDQEIFKVCTEIFETDFQELLNLPPMTRLSKGGLIQAMARFNQFKAAMCEFIYLLFLPLKKSLRDMRGALAEGGPQLEDFKEYYRKWLRTLEGHYMTLFKSPECTRTMSHALDALEDFNLAKETLLAEALAPLPILTHREMDDLYREIYLLKKRVKSLAKQGADTPPAGA